jgi:putative peptide zinc metalloprotease protein
MRRLPAFVLAAVLAAVLAGAMARPAAAAGDTTAVAVNVKDFADIFRFAFHVQRTTSDVVDESNAAVAFASCTECQTIAASFQVILIFSDPSVVSSQNLALALNYECTACETLASAYQWVLTTGGPVHFTAEGNKRLAALRRQLVELMKSDLSIEEVQAQLDQMAQELSSILATELVPGGPPPEQAQPAEPTTTDTTTEPTTTETTTTEPTTTTTP